MRRQHVAWYVTLIAGYYLVLCSFNILHFAGRYLEPGFIHSPREFLALAGAIAGWLYFFKPGLGHRGLLLLTAVAILSIGESDKAALLFHVTVLALLLLPYLTRRGKKLEFKV